MIDISFKLEMCIDFTANFRIVFKTSKITWVPEAVSHLSVRMLQAYNGPGWRWSKEEQGPESEGLVRVN